MFLEKGNWAQSNISDNKPESDSVIEKQVEYEVFRPQYVCEICKKDFVGPGTLKIHQRVHYNKNSDEKLSKEKISENLAESENTKCTEKDEAQNLPTG